MAQVMEAINRQLIEVYKATKALEYAYAYGTEEEIAKAWRDLEDEQEELDFLKSCA